MPELGFPAWSGSLEGWFLVFVPLDGGGAGSAANAQSRVAAPGSPIALGLLETLTVISKELLGFDAGSHDVNKGGVAEPAYSKLEIGPE